jgi:hypothetical protein
MDERRRGLMGRLEAAETGTGGRVTVEVSDLERRELVAALWDAEELKPHPERSTGFDVKGVRGAS